MSTRVLVVEDDPDIALALSTLLRRRGYDVSGAGDGREALRRVHDVRPALLVLDIGLPVFDGWEVLSRVRDISDVPVLLLTAAGRDEDKVRGLRAGADDYLTKPYSNAELLARVEALLRRAGDPSWTEPEFGDRRLRISPADRRVVADEEEVALSPLDFRLLCVLVRHAGQVLSTPQLLRLVWDDPSGLAPERVKFAVMRLRKKLGWAGQGSPVESVRGVGYRYRAATERQPVPQP